MAPCFSCMRHFGDNFGNDDVARRVSFFLNQRDKVALATSAKGVSGALKGLLPTSTEYVTSVKPNLRSLFSVRDDVVYYLPITLFKTGVKVSSFYRSMITCIGANEEKDYFPVWLEKHLQLEVGDARCNRGCIDIGKNILLPFENALLAERVRQSKDLELKDTDCFELSQEVLSALSANTSIVDVTIVNESSSCRCPFFTALSARTTHIVSLTVVGDLCFDTAQTIADSCIGGLTKISMASGESDQNMNGDAVLTVFDAIAEVGILEILELGKVVGEETWVYGLVDILDGCPLKTISIRETFFPDETQEEMISALSGLRASDVKLIACDVGGWGPPILDALFSGSYIKCLDLSFTEVEDDSVAALADMVKRGTLTNLGIGWCDLGKESIKSVLRATTHVGCSLEYISICDNDIDHPDVFEGLMETSLTMMNVGKLESDATIDALARFSVDKEKNNGDWCFVDTRDCNGWLRVSWRSGDFSPW